jgi:autotransporter-associated beta strand protein
MTNAINWSGGVAPSDNTAWAFTNSAKYALTNGFNGYNVTGITFANYTGSGYGISGNAFTLTGGITNNSIYTQIISNNLTVNSAVTLTNGISSAAYIQLSGNLTGNGTITYGAGNSGGRLILQSGNNTNFSGALIATSGRVNIGSSNSVSANADYTFNNSGGTFLVTPNNVYNFGSLSGNGNIQVNSPGNTNTVSVGAKNSSTTFSGIFSTNQNGTINVIKVGTGTLTLSGNNTYIGTTTISNGILQIGAGGTAGSISNSAAITLAGGTLAFNRSDTVTQGTSYLTNGGVITGNGGFLQMGGGTNILNKANTFSGTTKVSSGTLVLSNNLAIQNSAFDTTGTGTLSLGSGVTTPTLGGLSGNGSFNPTGYNSVTSLTLNVANGASYSYSGNLGNGASGMSLTKTDTGTQILSGNNTYTGGTTLNAGTLGVGNNSALGSGGLTVSGNSTLLAAADGLNIANSASLNSNTLTVDVQGNNLTSSGEISGAGALAKAGVGTLVLSGNNSYLGGTTLSNGFLAINSANSLGGASGALTFAGASTLRADASFTTGRNYVLNAATTIDTAGNNLNNTGVFSGSGVLTKAGAGELTLNGVNTYTNATVISGGTLTIGGAGQLNSGNYAGAITNNSTLNYASTANQTLGGIISGTGNLVKAGSGILTLGANNTYSGKTTITGGTISVSADARLGTAPGSFVADQLTLDGGTLGVTSSFTQNTNRGVTLGASGGTISVSSGAVLIATNSTQLFTGSGGLTKIGAGTLALGGANNYAGGTILNEGVLRLQSSTVISGGNIVSGALGVGNVTINGGTTLMGNSQSLYATNITIGGDFAVNSATGTTGNGRATLGGLFDMGGATRTISLGRYTNAAGAIQGGIESLRFGNSTDFNANYANGSLRFVRDANGTASDFASVNFTIAGQKFSGGGGFIIGSNVITTFGSGSVFTNSLGLLPTMTVETGGYLNLGSSIGANSQSIRSLSGTGGYVTSLANAASNSTATLTISNDAGDSATFGGQIVDGSSLNATLATSAANVKMALTKTGSGTQILSGDNTYTGTTTVSGGLLAIASTGSIQSSTNTVVNSSGTLLMNGTGGRTLVNNGGTLKGSGTLGDVVLNGGTLAPGNSPGLLTAASLDASSAGKFFFEIGAPTARGITYDAINVGGLLTMSSSTLFDFAAWNSYVFQASDTYDLLDWGTADFGSGATAFDSSTLLTSLNQDLALGAGLQWDVSTFTADGKITVAVPEPSSGALLVMGFAMLMGIRALRRP